MSFFDRHKVTKWFLIFLIVFITPVLSYVFYKNDFCWISYVADFVTILGLGGIYFNYKKERDYERKRIINEQLRFVYSIKDQLKIIGYWTGYKGGGYHKEDKENWIKKEFYNRANPFASVYKIEFNALSNITALPGLENVNKKITKAIANLNQWITSFNCYLDDIARLRYSRDVIENIKLSNKIKNLHEIIDDNNDILYMNKLVDMYTYLHFNIIGDLRTKTLHYWHNNLSKQLKILEGHLTMLKKEKSFNN